MRSDEIAGGEASYQVKQQSVSLSSYAKHGFPTDWMTPAVLGNIAIPLKGDLGRWYWLLVPST